MLKIQDWTFSRFVFHTIHAKETADRGGAPSMAEYSEGLLNLDSSTQGKLIERIETAFSRDNKQFKLEIARSDENSFFDLCHNAMALDDDSFFELSKKVADKLAESQKRANIPGGILGVIDGKTEKGKYFYLCLKAETHEAFQMKKGQIEVINKIFLSTDKKMYKIGLLLEDTNNSPRVPNDQYSCYMYDDEFDMQNKDLTEYFYKEFLGFTTSRNDKILSKNWYNETKTFFEEKITNVDDRQGLIKFLHSYLRENVKGTIEPRKFAESCLEGDLLGEYLRILDAKLYPTAFTKNLTAFDRAFKRQSIPLKYKLKLEGPTESVENHVTICDSQSDQVKKQEVKNIIDSGGYEEVIIIRGETKEPVTTN